MQFEHFPAVYRREIMFKFPENILIFKSMTKKWPTRLHPRRFDLYGSIFNFMQKFSKYVFLVHIRNNPSSCQSHVFYTMKCAKQWYFQIDFFQNTGCFFNLFNYIINKFSKMRITSLFCLFAKVIESTSTSNKPFLKITMIPPIQTRFVWNRPHKKFIPVS